VLAQNDRLQQIPIAQRDAQNEGGLSLAFRVQYLPRHGPIPAPQKIEALFCNAFVRADGVLGNQLEVSTISAARLAGRIPLVQHHDAQIAAPGSGRQMVSGGSAGQPRANDDDIRGSGQLWAGLVVGQGVAAPEPERLRIARQRDVHPGTHPRSP
jgi:hypothetical protein